MVSRTERVYQLKVTLKRSKPPIWRRILVPDSYTFWDLHVAIQDSMGWLDTHLHRFDLVDSGNRRVSIASYEDEFDEGLLPGHLTELREYLRKEKASADYSYDFGDAWEHRVVVEKIRERKEGEVVPACLAGRKACPPEDCGGVWGYYNLLAALSDPEHEQHSQLREWLGGTFDPDAFDPKQVRFDDPKDRWKLMIGFQG